MPLNTVEHLLVILSEECDEVGQRVSKALRFGLNETEPGQNASNRHRLEYELCDLLAMIEMLRDAYVIKITPEQMQRAGEAKKEKVRRFMEYSKELGTLV